MELNVSEDRRSEESNDGVSLPSDGGVSESKDDCADLDRNSVSVEAARYDGGQLNRTNSRESRADDVTLPTAAAVSTSSLKFSGSNEVRPASAARLIRVSPRVRDPTTTDSFIVPVRPLSGFPSPAPSAIVFQSCDTTFSGLDDAVASRVLLYLSPKDIAALSCTSKQLRGLSDSEYIWRALFRADFMPRPCDFRQLALSPPKFLYKSRLLQRKERLEAALREKKQSEHARKMESRQTRLHWLLSWYNLIFVIACPFPLALLNLIFLAYKINGSVSWSYWAVFAPVWAMSGLLTIALVFGVLAWRWRDIPGHISIWQNVWSNSDQTWAFQQFMIDYSLHTVRPRLHGLFLLCCALAAPIMVCAKLEGATMSWAVTFTPIWLFVLAYILVVFPCFHVWEDANMNKLLLFTWVLVLPGAISLALITSKLHGRDLSLNNAFVPLWIITAFALLVILLAWVVSSFQTWRQGNRRECLLIFSLVLLALSICVPLMLFLVFLVTNEQGKTHISPIRLFSPLFVTFSILSAFFVVMTAFGIVWFRNHSRTWVW